MQAEQGHTEIEAARGTQEAKGIGDQLKGNVKEGAGKILGNEKVCILFFFLFFYFIYLFPCSSRPKAKLSTKWVS
jgi:hypothetical protein